MPPPISIHVSPRDEAPLYRQVVRQVLQGIASGALLPGERMPSLRALAQELVVAPLTVKKAYDVLEADGVIETRRGRGTFVRAAAARSTQDAVEGLRPLARRLAVEADVAGLEQAALLELVRIERAALRDERRERGQAS